MLPRAGLAAILAFSVAAPPITLSAQDFTLELPDGRQTVLPRDSLLVLLEGNRALNRWLVEDPDILYYVGTVPAVPPERPSDAYPWNAIEVLSDSTATVRTPANLREADRAYRAYAVLRMEGVQEAGPEDDCEVLRAREEAAVEAFADGWIVARALYGGPPYPPLDEIPVARGAGHLRGLLAHLSRGPLEGCPGLAEEAEEEARAYRAWRDRAEAEVPEEAERPAEEGR